MKSQASFSTRLAGFSLVFATLCALSAKANASMFQGNWCTPPDPARLEKEQPAQDPCLDRGTSLVALTDLRLIYLCKDGAAQANYDLALGRGGLDKMKDGDLKTPTGTYSLGSPRESEKFSIFIPVGYPTSAQKSEGYTGGAIGVHGPARMFKCVGSLTVSMNWTQGCLAVATDAYIAEIATFVKSNKVRTIHILK